MERATRASPCAETPGRLVWREPGRPAPRLRRGCSPLPLRSVLSWATPYGPTSPVSQHSSLLGRARLLSCSLLEAESSPPPAASNVVFLTKTLQADNFMLACVLPTGYKHATETSERS